MLNVLGYVISALGAVMGIVGSLFMANAYHRFPFKDLLLTFWDVLVKLLKGRSAAMGYVEMISRTSQGKPENRTLSLIGLCMVFGGFLLQLVGSTVSFAASFLPPAK
jgi:hypothetical protein